MRDTRPRALVYGNCQGGWLSRALAADPEIASQFEIVYLSDYYARPKDHPADEPGFFATCSVVIWQTASGYKGPSFLAEIPAHVRQIRYPTLWLKLLWPTYAVDPRNVPDPQFPWGRYPYGDRLVMKLLEDGVSPADVPQRYAATDLNGIVNLARFTEMSMAELRFNDRQSDIAITPYIEKIFRTRRLFGAINHPTFAILHQIYHGVAAALLDRPAPIDQPPPANADDVLGDQEIPLHPQVIEYFGLTWAFPGMKWRYHSAFLTPQEYFHAYAAFTPIPLGQPPQLWLARARQAAERGDLANAQRILLEASARYPGIPDFFLYLARVLLNRNQLLAAEKVLRLAISRHPENTPLQSELDLLLLQRKFANSTALTSNS